MKDNSDILAIYRPTLFWDINISKLDIEKSSRLIIERVFSLGTIAEIRTLIKYYGKERVIETLSELNYLDPKTLNFISVLFHKPKNEFRCYLKKQSGPRLWNS